MELLEKLKTKAEEWNMGLQDAILKILKETLNQPLTVKLKRGSKGQYTWEIQNSDSNADSLLYTIDYIDSNLREKYLPKEAQKEDVLLLEEG
jgi:small nuclear ribonucleoprotein (snRNP)-like protein